MKNRLSLVLLVACAIGALTSSFSVSAQDKFLSLSNIFGTGPAGQTITSNASGVPIAVPAGGILGVANGQETVAMAGSAQGDAAALSASKFLHQITGADGTKGVILPATTITSAAICHFLLNTTAGVAKVYPATGGTINGGSANAAFTALTGVKPIICCASATDTWVCA